MTSSVKFDYSSVLLAGSNDNESWESLVPANLPIGRQVEELLKLGVHYPDDCASFTYRVLASYLLIPSALCTNLPILFLFGASGSGKSQVSKLASVLWNCKIFSPADTFAAIRNEIDSKKKQVIEYWTGDSQLPHYKECEANMMMVWDDIDPNILTTKPDIFRMLKVGCDRRTSVISLSGDKVGVNMMFDCFSPKIFSSISPLHAIPELGELKRRMLVIPHRRSDFLPIFYDDYLWETLSKRLAGFWDLTSAGAFVDFRNRLSQRHKLRDAVEASRWFILRDFITTGFVTGIWQHTEQAVEDLTSFFNWQHRLGEISKGELETLIEGYIKECESACMHKIYNSNLRNRVDSWLKARMLFDRPRRGEVSEIMQRYGYICSNAVWTKNI
jgi:hypothetical protein